MNTKLISLALLLLLSGYSWANNLPECIKYAKWQQTEISRTDLRETQLAIKTNQGNYALLNIRSGDALIVDKMELYSQYGEVINHWQHISVGSSYSFDADLGQVSSEGSDFWWQGIRAGVNNLVPQSGVSVYLCTGNEANTINTNTNSNTITVNNSATVRDGVIADTTMVFQDRPKENNQPANTSNTTTKPPVNNENPMNKPNRNKKFWQDKWDTLVSTKEEDARKGKCHAGWDLNRCPPSYCEIDKHCQFGHYWGVGIWDQEFDGLCIQNECKENKDTNLDPDDSPCRQNAQCNNMNFEGYCDSNKQCVSTPRKSCDTPGADEICITPDKKSGHAVCRDWGKLSTCIEIKS